ncbi:sugar ABC transporter substrate-binding protein [Acrocarpospora phusangensis]|uniref:sugar ABC transporter substrate-binding protein n=1 Tax=Acrocarpospora phusangensis TaxID=1070424 RepID=UPI001EF369DD|nr:substrate-binding domain-containing protein [Acrocarpospora phusangensis]
MTVAFLIATVTGCATEPRDSAGGYDVIRKSTPPPVVEDGFKIGLLLPESGTARYEKFDRPYVSKYVKELCPACTLLYANAQQDPARQRQQIDAMLAQGVQVLILDAVDAKAVAPSVEKAAGKGVKIVAYDRLAEGPIHAYSSIDNIEVGKMQGQALIDALKMGGNPARGPIVMVNGPPADPNAGEFKKGAHQVLDSRVVIGKEFDIPDWSAEQARIQALAAFTALGAGNVIGVYSANDGMAGGIAKAMRSAGIPKGTPLTGQDADLAAIQRILLGTQTMTIYKPIEPEAESAVRMAIDLASGRTPTAPSTVRNTTVHAIPAMITAPMVVTRDNIKDTVVRDGFWTVREICAPKEVRPACKSTGLT